MYYSKPLYNLHWQTWYIVQANKIYSTTQANKWQQIFAYKLIVDNFDNVDNVDVAGNVDNFDNVGNVDNDDNVDVAGNVDDLDNVYVSGNGGIPTARDHLVDRYKTARTWANGESCKNTKYFKWY